MTERKRAGAELRASEARFRSLTALSSDWYWEQDENLRFTYLSNQAQALTGYSAESSLGKTRWEIANMTPLSCSWPEHQAVLAAREPFRDLECRRVGPDGTVRYLSMSGEPLFDEQGRFKGYHGIGRNITDRKLAEQALRESQERYALAVAGSDAGVWDYDFVARRHFSSPRARELAGLPPEPRTLPMHEGFAVLPLHPEDVPRRIAAMQAHLAGKTPMYEGEFRVRQPDGSYRWRRIQGLCVRDAHGKPLRLAGSISDVDARKRAEALLSGEKRILERVAKGEPLRHVLDELCRLVEELAPGVLASILLLEGNRLRHGGAPSLPKAYSDAIDGAVIGPSGGSCGTAAYRGQQVIVSDIAADALWADYRALALPHGLRACWSTPVFSPEGKVIATFAMYYREPRSPSAQDQQIIEQIGHLAGVAIQHKLAADELRESEARFRGLTELWSDWYWRQDENLRFTYSSAAISPPEGYPGGSAIGKTRWELPGIVPLSSSWAEHQALLAARKPFRDFEYSRPADDGTMRYIATSGAPIFDEQGNFEGYQGTGRDITKRKRVEEELRRSRHYLAEAQRLSHIGSWAFNAAGFEHWSPELFKIHGLDPGGKAPSIPEYLALVHPEDRDFVVQEIEKILAGAEGFDFKKRIVRPDGSIRQVRCVGIRASTGGIVQEFVGTGMDVTEQERAEEGLRKSEERYALVVAGSNEGIFDWDLVSDRAYVSHRAQELFGLPRGELWRPRRDWRHILTFHPDDAPRLHDSIKAHIQGGAPTYDVEFRIVLPGGGVRWFRQRGIALRDASGKAYRVVGSIGDVTEQHKAEEELSRLERQLRLAQRLEAMGTLAGGIAHDFNNILGAILGFSEMAWRDAPKGSRLQRDLESIATAGERGRALVERILAFSRSGVGERVAVHVEQVVREALDLLSAKLPPSITLSAELRAGRAAVLGDPTQVHQVLMNLGTNAVQAMPSGGMLRVSLDAVRCEAARAATVGKIAPGDYIVLQVVDNGSGIAPEILERIFDPFFTTKELGTGTGLGLSLVHGIVAELGGAVDVESAPGKGTAFTVCLPRSGDALDSSVKEQAELPRGGGQRVLIVDDEEPLVRLATRTLEDLGYRPVGFTSSAAALAAFCAEPGHFDALIADERMPGLSGTALIREVRGVRRAIPILLMSGYIGGAVASLAREAGANDVLKKPLLARDLATSLARVLRA